MKVTDMLWFDGDKGTVFDLTLNTLDNSVTNGDPNSEDREGRNTYKNNSIVHDIMKAAENSDLRLS